jgi:hypothetical protein
MALGDHEVVVVHTSVYMRAYSHAEIERYVASGDPMDKAGAYAIQHAHFAPIAHIAGCYANVMGLPMCHLYRALTDRWRSSSTRPHGDKPGLQVRHPLDSCPYAIEHADCPWTGPILDRIAQPED